MSEIKLTFKDSKCPVFLADAQPVVVWSSGDGVVRAQFRSLHITDPATAAAEVSPLVEVAMPLPVFFSLQDGVNGQAEQLKQQGVQRLPLSAATPPNPGGGQQKH